MSVFSVCHSSVFMTEREFESASYIQCGELTMNQADRPV